MRLTQRIKKYRIYSIYVIVLTQSLFLTKPSKGKTSMANLVTSPEEAIQDTPMAMPIAQPPLTPTTPELTLSPFENFLNQLERVYHHPTNNPQLGLSHHMWVNSDRRGNPHNAFNLSREINVVTIGVNTNNPIFLKPLDTERVIIICLNNNVNGEVLDRNELNDERVDALIEKLNSSKLPSEQLLGELLSDYKTLADK